MKMIEYKNDLIVETDGGEVLAYHYADENEQDDNIVEVKCGSVREAKAVIDKHLKGVDKN